jgi:hypothetical protein
MLLGRAAQRPQCLLQTFGQSHDTLAAEHDMAVLEAGEGEPEVVEPMVERLTGNGNAEVVHAEVVHDGEIRQAKPSRLMPLAEDHVLLRPMDGPPGADPTLEGATYAGTEIGMTAQHLLELGDRTEGRRRLQHRHELLVPQTRVWIRSVTTTDGFLDRGQIGILVDTVGA